MTIFFKHFPEDLRKENAFSFQQEKKHFSRLNLSERWKKWALAHGANRFAYWFQPIRWKEASFFILSPKEPFGTKDLLQSSVKIPFLGPYVPQKEGFLQWDCVSRPFLMEESQEMILCIPALLFLRPKKPFDEKMFLIRSTDKIEKNGERLCRMFDLSLKSQVLLQLEYACLDRSVRKDLGFFSKADLLKEGGIFLSCVESVDLDLLWMKWMRSKQENLISLLQNMRSCRRVSWSLGEKKESLLDCTRPFVFLTLLTAFIWALHEHRELIWASFCSLGNDLRLQKKGISFSSWMLDLGDSFTEILQEIVQDETLDVQKYEEKLRCCTILKKEESDAWFFLNKDQIVTDLLGSSGSVSFFACGLNAVISDGMSLILDEMARAHSKASRLSILQKHLIEAREVFCKNTRVTQEFFNKNWFKAFLEARSIRCFQEILEEGVLQIYEITFLERYVTEIEKMISVFLDQEGPKMPVFRDLLMMREQFNDLGLEAKLKVFFELWLPKLRECGWENQ